MASQGKVGGDEGFCLVLSADRNYLPHFATTVTSALESSASSISRVFLLSSELSQSDLSDFNQTVANQHGKFVEVVNVPSSMVEGFFVSHHVSTSTYNRFFIAELLPDTEDVALYLDCDTLVLGDLASLVDLAQAWRHVSPDEELAPLSACVQESEGFHLEKHGFHPGSYFNAGVMLINLVAWRRENIGHQLANRAADLHGLLRWWDQDVLNLVLENRWIRLEESFNFTGKEAVAEPKIVHFAGGTKPWHYGCLHPNRNDYAKFRSKTPFSSFRRSQLSKYLAKRFFPRWMRKGKTLNKSIRKLLRAVRRKLPNPARLLKRWFLGVVRRSHNSLFSSLVSGLAREIIKARGTSMYLRRVVDFSAAAAPLDSSLAYPSIHLHIVAASKDFALLPIVVSQALAHCLNPIEKILVIVPDGSEAEVPALPDLVQVIGETGTLAKSTFALIDSHHPDGRRGWILQQALKLWSARNSEAPGVLILDSDTVLTKPRVFLGSEGKQLLSYSHEYHVPYEIHAAKIWGPRKRDIGLSYVCHHQLMQPKVVREMFPSVKELERWLLEADVNERSPIADYHSYGRWLVENYPSRVSYARWGNKSVPINRDGSTEQRQVADQLRESSDEAYSISFHHYLHQSGQSS